MTNLVERLNGLWREVDALGGTARNEFESGYAQGVIQASVKLEEAGFSEGRSEAADEITRLQSALSVSQAQGEVMRAALVAEAQRWGNEALAKSAESSRRANRLGDDPFGHGDMAREGADHLNTAGRELLAFAEHMKTFVLQSTPPTAVARVIEAARELEPHLDGLICYASTTSEHEPNRLVLNLRKALAGLDGGRKG